MKKTKSLILQIGESTHTHNLESKADIRYEEGTAGDIHFLLDGKGILKHEEHGTMVFEAGNYFKYPQMEFSPLDNNIRQVFD